jgi:CRP/FNR family transcriptional regulator, cyclic AMP receptor protein
MNIDDLVAAVQSLNSDDAFRPEFSREQWGAFAAYLSPLELHAGDVLIKLGATDRTMYLLERGAMLVSAGAGTPRSRRIGILRAGSMVGEPMLFGHSMRMADVEAMTACRLWALRPHQLDELTAHEPAIARELLRAAGVVMAVRLVTFEGQLLAA